MGETIVERPAFVGFTASAFDLLHAGHILMLQEAKEVCDHLVVGLHVDPSQGNAQKNKPIQSLVERYIQLDACKYIDEIFVYETEEDLLLILSTLRPDVRIIGEDYQEKDFTGKKLCQELGIHIHYNSRKHNFSSSELRERIKQS